MAVRLTSLLHCIFVVVATFIIVQVQEQNQSYVTGLALINNNNNSKKSPISNTKTLLPKYDKNEQKWIVTGSNQLPESGYPASKTLLMHGPKPFITRVFQSNDYEQAVLKFMASDKVISRNVAQGNMDAYLRNPQDWMYNRMESTRLGIEIDYTSISTQGVILVLVWSSIVISTVGRIVYSVTNNVGFYDFLQ